jgi:hypothetical protein
VERASLRLLLSLTPWIQTDLLSNVVERVVGHRSVWRCGRHWLEFLQTVPSPRRQPSDLRTSNNRFRALNLGPRGT